MIYEAYVSNQSQRFQLNFYMREEDAKKTSKYFNSGDIVKIKHVESGSLLRISEKLICEFLTYPECKLATSSNGDESVNFQDSAFNLGRLD